MRGNWVRDCRIKRLLSALGSIIERVSRLRQCCVESGLEAALEAALEREPRCRERARVLDGDGEARVLALMCGDPPAGQSRWTLNLLSERWVELGVVESVSHETLRKVLKKTPSNRG